MFIKDVHVLEKKSVRFDTGIKTLSIHEMEFLLHPGPQKLVYLKW